MQEGGPSVSVRHQQRQRGWGPHDRAAGDPATGVPTGDVYDRSKLPTVPEGPHPALR